MQHPIDEDLSLGTPLRLQPNPHAPFSKSRRRRPRLKTPCMPRTALLDGSGPAFRPNVFGPFCPPTTTIRTSQIMDGPVSRQRSLTYQTPESPETLRHLSRVFGVQPSSRWLPQTGKAPALQAQSPRTSRGQFHVVGHHNRSQPVGNMQPFQQVKHPACRCFVQIACRLIG